MSGTKEKTPDVLYTIVTFSILIILTLGTLVISLSWFFSYSEIVAWKIEKTDLLRQAWPHSYSPFLYSSYKSVF